MKVTKAQIKAGAAAAHAYLDKRYPDGALPGGVQIFSDPGDHMDSSFKHEEGCEELAEAVLRASLNV